MQIFYMSFSYWQHLRWVNMRLSLHIHSNSSGMPFNKQKCAQVYQKPLCLDKFVVEPSSIQHDNSNNSRNTENLYDLDNLKDLSCKHFKATAFLYEPATTITKLDNGEIEYVSNLCGLHK